MQDAADFWNADVEQTNALFDQMVKQMESKGFSIKEYSAVYCDEAERDADFAKRLPAPPAAEPEQKPKPKSGPSVIGSKIDGIMAGESSNCLLDYIQKTHSVVSNALLSLCSQCCQAPSRHFLTVCFVLHSKLSSTRGILVMTKKQFTVKAAGLT